MALHILKCQKCGKYTMKEACDCGGAAIHVKPAKYSPQDQYGEYRRRVKEPGWKENGLL